MLMFVSNYVCIISCLQAWSSAFSFAILENLQSRIFRDYLFTYVRHFINVYIKWHAHCTRTSSLPFVFLLFLLYFALFLPFIYHIFILIFSCIFFASRIYTLYLILFHLFVYISPFFMFTYKNKLESDD